MFVAVAAVLSVSVVTSAGRAAAEDLPPGYSTSNQVLCDFNKTFLSYGGQFEMHWYVSTELAYNDSGPYPDKGMLRARALYANEWEKYTFCQDLSDGSWTIYSPAAHAFVSAELLYPDDAYPWRKGMLRARAATVGPWEKFDIVDVSPYSDKFSIRSRANGLLVSAELGYGEPYKGMLRARNEYPGPYETFCWYPDCV
jgi:hypothetical protein